MKICPNCGASNPDNRSRCEYCKSYIGNEEISVDTTIDDIKNAVSEKEERAKEIAEKLNEVFKTLAMTDEESVLSNELQKYRDKLQAEYRKLTGHLYFYELPSYSPSVKEKVITIILSLTFLVGIFVLMILSNIIYLRCFR